MRNAPRAWQRMRSGSRLNLLDPTPIDIDIEDIALGLSRVARWNGQTSGEHPFSVAEHSLLVERLAIALKPTLSPACRLTALLHDAPEYVIGDLISPFKAMIGGEYRALEERLLTVILARFKVPAIPKKSTWSVIKRADKAAAYIEAISLAGFLDRDGGTTEADRIFGRPKDIDVEAFAPTPLGAKAARAAFLERFEAIRAEIDRPPAGARPIAD